MSGAHRSNSRSTTTNRKKGTHRVAPKPARQPYNWLGVGAITLGLGAAMASGTGVASAKGGPDSSSSSSGGSNNASHSHTNNSANSGTKSHHKHTEKAKTADGGTGGSDNSGTGKAGSAPVGATTGGSSDATDSSGSAGISNGKHTGKKHRPATDDQSGQPKTKRDKKDRAAANVAADSANVAVPAPNAAATPAAADAPAPASTTTPPKTPSTAKAVALSAVSAAAADDLGSSTTTTTPKATSSNPIIAAIQNALISFFTAPATIAMLADNGLTGPVQPNFLLNPIGAIMYGFVRGMQDFAGLVPKVGNPTTISDPVTGTVSGSLDVTVPAGGPDLTYSVYSHPLFGSVTINTDGTYSYKSNIFGAALAALGLNPTDNFTVTASDGIAATNVTVTVSVLAANNTPSTPTATNINQNAITGTVTGTFTSTSPDGSAISYSVTQPVQGHLVVDANGNFTYTPTDLARLNANLGVITTDTFTVTATNEAGKSSLPAFITVPVAPASANTPSTPTVTNQHVDAVTGVVTGTIASTSPDGSAVTYSYTQPVQGSLTIDANGTFTYTPTDLARLNANLGVITTDTFTVTVSNGSYSTLPKFVTVPVSPANADTPSTPTVTNQAVNGVTGVVTGTFSSSANPGETITYSVTQPVQGHLVVDANGNFTYTPTPLARENANLGVITTDTFTVTATNGNFTSGIGWITVPVSPASNATPSTPTVTNQVVNQVTGVVTGSFSSTSPDGGAVTYSYTQPVQGSLTVDANGNFTYTPTKLARQNADLGVILTDTFTVTASNSMMSSGVAFITVPVSPAKNDKPSAVTVSGQVQNTNNGVVTGTLAATSPDGATLSYSITTGTIGGMSLSTGEVTLSTSNGVTTFTYTPTHLAMSNSNILGPYHDTFIVTVSNGVSSTGTTITVPVLAKCLLCW